MSMQTEPGTLPAAAPSDRIAETRPVSRDWGRYAQQAALIGVIAALAAFFHTQNSVFLSGANVIELLRSGTLYFMVACPVTLILVAGGLDFSVGSVYALGAVTTGLLITHGVAWPLAIVAGVAVGVTVGILNGGLSVFASVPPLIATIGTFFVAGGIAVVLTGGQDVYGFPDAFNRIGGGELAGIPNLIFYAVFVGVIFHLLLEKTVFGYNVRATGGSRAAAAANGIRVHRVDISLYAISGGVAALAGILGAARLADASPVAGGSPLTFQVLTAVIIGGTSLFGGVGTVAGSALGALLFAEIDNGLQVINTDPLYQQIFVGIILVTAVALDGVHRRRRFHAVR